MPSSGQWRRLADAFLKKLSKEIRERGGPLWKSGSLLPPRGMVVSGEHEEWKPGRNLYFAGSANLQTAPTLELPYL